MKHIFILLLSLAFINLNAQKAQDKDCKKNLLVMSYNVENLFDTLDTPNKIDQEFLPEGKKQWTSKRYHKKLEDLSKVISSVDKNKLPDLVALTEVETKIALDDLVQEKALKKAKYQIIHHEGPDVRGIDVALLYNLKQFNLLNTHFYPVTLEDNPQFKTREILYAKLVFKKTKDTLHIFVNHWPSRRGGQAKSEHKRFAAAQVLRHVTDSLFKTDVAPSIMIMGDFNDEPLDKSLVDVLEAKPISQVEDNHLYNLSLDQQTKDIGTYFYWKTQEWNMLDQFIVSGSLLLSDQGLQMKDKDMGILREEFFLYKNKEGVMTPSKTYGGKKYYGGYSDHLPVYHYFYYKCK